MSVCSIDGCDRQVKAKGWCNGHYLRWRRHGDPLASSRRVYPSLEERLPHKIRELPSGCWEWLGGRKPSGYGNVSVGGQTRIAHRAVYELLVGPILEGLVLDHLCGNTSCVNPAHLEPVTQRENNMRSGSLTAIHARKTHCIHGHEFTDENIYWSNRGGRGCRTCALRRAAAGRVRRG